MIRHADELAIVRDTEQSSAKFPDVPGAWLFDNEASSPLNATIALVAGASLLDGCGGASGGSGNTVQVSPDGAAALAGASRFLSQASIGYSKSDVTALAASSIDAWLTTQFGMARLQKFWDFLIAQGYATTANNGNNVPNGFDAMVWSQLISSGDILRQRVGLALLDIWVVSADSSVQWPQFVVAAYLDILWNNAFGNYRDIMESVSTSVAMGFYLTYLGSVKGDPSTGRIADENYARESMQLFTIGLYQLNMDGSQVLSGGQPAVNYTQADVIEGARVWTGYDYANYDNSTPARMQLPMIINADLHDTGPISLLNDAISIPSGTDGATARKLALDGLFSHSSMPPFVSQQLIQRLVTSNPSAAYVSRVTRTFADNGSGVRGDMMAVIRAILTDTEARDDTQANSTSFGKLREPVVRLTQWARAFKVTSPTNAWPFGNLSYVPGGIGESPGHAPSVFNWFSPRYTLGNTAAALLAPEFQITSETTLISYVNYMQNVITGGAGEAVPDYSSLTALATDSKQILDELNLVLAADQISDATIASMKTALDTISTTDTAGINNRIYAAILLVMASPEYLVLR